MSLSRY